MGGQHDPWSQPPSAEQMEGLCQETAAIARSWGWDADAISIATMMIHAEAASNRDGRIMHDNYGPMLWGGTGERWDLWQLERNGSHNGGEQLRERIRTLLKKPASSTATPPATAASDATALRFKRTSHMRVRGEEMEVAIDAAGLSWARAADLLNRYGISYSWDSAQQRVLIGSLDVAPHLPPGWHSSLHWLAAVSDGPPEPRGSHDPAGHPATGHQRWHTACLVPSARIRRRVRNLGAVHPLQPGRTPGRMIRIHLQCHGPHSPG